MPDKSGVSQISVTVLKVYDQKNTSTGKVCQDARIRDASGEIKLTVWDHPDIKMYEGKEVIIQAGPKGGLTVKYDNFNNRNTNTLSMSKFCTFQLLQVAQAQSSAGTSAPAQQYQPAQEPKVVINGAKVGMSINVASQFMIEAGELFSSKRLHELASAIIKVSNDMENGVFAGDEQPF